MPDEQLRYGPLTHSCAHLCVDMQSLFAEDTEWNTPWMGRVLPMVERIARARPDRSIYTRFIPPERPQDAKGTWRRYYTHWHKITRAELDPRLLELVPALKALVPPGVVIDKGTYSPWFNAELERQLAEWEIDTLVISGAETDVCVLAAVMGAVDRGFRVIVPTDALCSSSDETHDALLTLYHHRYGRQIETARTEAILASWT